MFMQPTRHIDVQANAALMAAFCPPTKAVEASICMALGPPFSATIDQSAGQLLTNDIGTLHSRLDIRSACPSGLARNSWEYADVHSQFIFSSAERGGELTGMNRVAGCVVVYVAWTRECNRSRVRSGWDRMLGCVAAFAVNNCRVECD